MEKVSPFYEKQEKCLLCQQTFPTTKIRTSFVKVKEHDTDLKPIYEGDINPLFYNVKICVHCGFSYTDDFAKYFAPNVKEELQEKVASQWVSQNYGSLRTIHQAINSYKLAIYNGMIKREKHLTIAGLALRTAWLYRDLENSAQEIRFLEMAAKQYEYAYLNEDLTATQMSEVKVLYLIAELLRRSGHLEEAATYFSKVIEKQRISNDKKIIEMARDRWYELRETMKHSS
ncbi:uncharacterized protein (DUF2225 family) [Bacillus ectoiniformans]|uniref:DUF2225 domain-containing protein n=1 Tax=Bacillus ectoiniformans TaxID=1494429 RepID=UPI00195D8DE6|nr:DUF2225 domain-containing protein [Bacillus ectoiniformans]MBM7648532.1 uncharacterized protein (DUF2225 family) [Bacillus ectoiniformans]